MWEPRRVQLFLLPSINLHKTFFMIGSVRSYSQRIISEALVHMFMFLFPSRGNVVATHSLQNVLVVPTTNYFWHSHVFLLCYRYSRHTNPDVFLYIFMLWHCDVMYTYIYSVSWCSPVMSFSRREHFVVVKWCKVIAPPSAQNFLLVPATIIFDTYAVLPLLKTHESRRFPVYIHVMTLWCYVYLYLFC
jgi:hypothetical protein